MDPTAMESISIRLSTIEDLYFPQSLNVSSSSSSPSTRKTHLLSLLSRDPSIFLERYGHLLSPSELHPFQTLAHDYSIQFHLRRLNPSDEDLRSRSVKIKNRRRAYLDRLVEGGEYFAEEAMREREPYLHYEMVGRYQDPEGRMMSRPGERWSETLMRRCEEAKIVGRIRGEQMRRGVDSREWVGGGDDDEEEEEEEIEEVESEEEESDGLGETEQHGDQESNGHHRQGTVPFKPSISAEEMQEQLDQFTHIMQQKFLAGEDTEHLDYSKIDNDERLDDHWFKEASHDAEEKYFDED